MPETLLITAILAAIIFFIYRSRSNRAASSCSPASASGDIPPEVSPRGARHIPAAASEEARQPAPRHAAAAAETDGQPLFRDEDLSFKSKADPSRASRRISSENDRLRLEHEKLILSKQKAAHDAMRVFRDEASFEEQHRITEQELCYRDDHTFGETVGKGILFLLRLLWRLIKWVFTGIGMLFLFCITSSRNTSSDEPRHRSDSSFDFHRSNRSNDSPASESIRSASASRPINSVSSSPASPNNIHSSHSRHTASSRPSASPPKRSGGGGLTRGGGTGGRF